MTGSNDLPPTVQAAIAQREAEVLGRPPRIAPPDRSAIIDEVRKATGRLRQDLFGDPNPMPDEQIPQIMFTMQPFGRLWERLMGMSLQLLGPEAVLPRRDQKLAILRTAWLLMAPYEWGEHAKQAKGLGVSREELDRIVEHGSASPLWSRHEAAVIRAAEELRQHATLTEETWQTLAESFSIQQIFELLVLIGQFTNVAYFQNALRLPLERGNDGLATR